MFEKKKLGFFKAGCGKCDARENSTMTEVKSLAEREKALFIIPPKETHAFADNLKKSAAINRLHALSCIKSAEHGWLGASWSCCEILTFLHSKAFDHLLSLDSVFLSKGHAAAMLYACLYSMGKVSQKQLLSYKNGKDGLEAHADLVLDTGSLGQCLSAVAGMNMIDNKTRAVILGYFLSF